ncbi:MAG: hypothetical protein ACLSVD_07375 [Eggerthellaceae bacterium]
MVNEEPLTELLGIVDAANIDLKGFTQDLRYGGRRPVRGQAHHRNAGGRSTRQLR